MTIATVGLLHPGAMGAAVGRVLTQTGRTVLWASEGRSAESGARAREADLQDAGTVVELAARSDLVLAICPPHGALDTARAIGPFAGLYVDANAVSPATAAEIRAVVRGRRRPLRRRRHHRPAARRLERAAALSLGARRARGGRALRRQRARDAGPRR